MIELYDFQGHLTDDLRTAICSGYSAPLLVSPCGSGKTVIFSYLTGRMSLNGLRCAIMVHRKELIDQVSNTLDDFDVPHARVAAGEKYDPGPMVYTGSIFTAVRRLARLQPPDYVILDEAHHAIKGSTWAKCLDYWRMVNPKLRLIGVTATPERLGGEGLKDTFDTMVIGPGTRELIDAGYLADYDIYAPPVPLDTSQLKIQAGDYKKSDAEQLVNRPSITGSAVDHYRKYLNGRPAIAYAVSVAHAMAVAQDFRSAGFRATTVYGAMKNHERQEAFRDLRSGQLNLVASCDLISEGLDVPGIFGALFLRPTESYALFIQQCGRPLRLYPGKERAIILDHVGNTARHGLPCTERTWTLEGKKRMKRKDPDDIAIRQCPYCGAVSPLAAMKCRSCGYEYPVKARTIKEVEGELEQIRNKERYEFKKARSTANDLASLIEVGRMRGMNNPRGWAEHVLEARTQKRERRLL